MYSMFKDLLHCAVLICFFPEDLQDINLPDIGICVLI